LAKGNPVDIGFLLRRIHDIGGEFARFDALVIVHGDEDAQLPFLTVGELLGSGLDGVSLILKSLSHFA
jgi:hypothetical protein